jgi:hypothetical protein
MKFSRSTLLGMPWLCLAATGFLIQGCAPRAPAWNGIYAIDAAGQAKTCVAATVSPPDGQTVQAQVQVSDEGGWCGEILNRGGVAYDSYLLVTRPSHGRVFAHHVGTNTRIDYTPDPGYVGTDSFAVRLIPGNAIYQETVTVVR